MKFVHIDAHTHVQFPAYNEDRKEVIERARAAGIALVNAGADRASSEAAVRVAHEFPEGVFATVGLHPTENEVFDEDVYRTLARDEKVVAIGECGLDYFRLVGDTAAARAKQQETFLAQVRLAHEVGKPLMIHCRNAMSDLIALLNEQRALLRESAGVMHFFTGSPEDAEALLRLGFYFTFGGVITFSHDYDGAVARIPLDRLLTETDAPYVTPVPNRGKRNEPLFALDIECRLADMKGVAADALAAQVVANAERVFGVKLG